MRQDHRTRVQLQRPADHLPREHLRLRQRALEQHLEGNHLVLPVQEQHREPLMLALRQVQPHQLAGSCLLYTSRCV